MAQTQADKDFERLKALLDLATEQVRKGDAEAAMLAIQEGIVTAKRLPQKSVAICLPDRSGQVQL